MSNDIPFFGKMYKIVSGPYEGVIGVCVSYDLESDLPIILSDKNWKNYAVKMNEVASITSHNTDIQTLQKN